MILYQMMKMWKTLIKLLCIKTTMHLQYSSQNHYQHEVLDSVKAEFMILKSLVVEELHAINLNNDTVWTEQCDQTKQLEDNSKNMWEEIATKNTIVKLSSENLNQITNSYRKANNKIIITKNQENGNCELLKDNSFMRSKDKNIFKSHVTSCNNIATFNCFAKLCNDESSNDVTEQNNQNNVIVTTPGNDATE